MADNAASSYSSSDDDDDDSDDDFLTLNKQDGTNGGESREALVRKKLLENFYGKSAVAAAHQPAGLSSDDDDDDDDPILNAPSRGSFDNHMNDDDDETQNLDHPSFDAAAHVRRHVWEAPVHDLLETQERLALQVRTLDSAMQTLVYENYSRFIDATDAIKSIGIHVQARESGLSDLAAKLRRADAASAQIERATGALRDQVAEKMRVGRLLARLDALLKLPETLRADAAAGRYRTAARSYLSAANILRQHSEGFESLRSIEAECSAILRGMRQRLTLMLWHWSGRSTADEDRDVVADRLPELPKSATEIFECAGTLCILLNEPSTAADNSSNNDDDGSPQLDADDLQTMALAAASRALDRLLDAHLIQVQERRFSSGLTGVATMDDLSSSAADPLQLHGSSKSLLDGAATTAAAAAAATKGSALVPRDALDAILQVATLYGLSFGAHTQTGYLRDFVAESLESFFAHVRAVLLEEAAAAQQQQQQQQQQQLSPWSSALDDDATADPSVHADPSASESPDQDTTENNNNNNNGGGGGGNDEAADATQEEISGALALLVAACRETAAGLALPEVGLPSAAAERFVERALRLTDSMVRLRVDQTFLHLRRRVHRECLRPLAERAPALFREADGDALQAWPAMAQAAASALNDCLQLVDDAVRSVLSNALEDGSGHGAADNKVSPDLPIVKSAVQTSTRRFAAWLASAFELLAGGDVSENQRMVDAEKVAASDGGGAHGTAASLSSSFRSVDDEPGGQEASEVHSQTEILADLAHAAKRLLFDDDAALHRVFCLALADMCRVAESSVSDSLEQSIAIHLGGSKRKKGLLLPSDSSDELKEKKKLLNAKRADTIAARFRTASCRILALYATHRGAHAAHILCEDLEDLMDEDAMPQKPRTAAIKALELVKTVSLECANAFGCPKRAGPLPSMEVNPVGVLSSPLLARKTGLQLDVERIFKEKVTIFVHPSDEMEFTGNAVLFLMCKVAFRALLEHARLLFFSASGYRQLQLDVEFFKHLMPHYVESDYARQGSQAGAALSTLLGDVMAAVEDRCAVQADNERDELLRTTRMQLRRFLETLEKSEKELGDMFLIPPDA